MSYGMIIKNELWLLMNALHHMITSTLLREETEAAELKRKAEGVDGFRGRGLEKEGGGYNAEGGHGRDLIGERDPLRAGWEGCLSLLFHQVTQGE